MPDLWDLPARVDRHDDGYETLSLVTDAHRILAIRWLPQYDVYVSHGQFRRTHALHQRLPAYDSVIIADDDPFGSACIGWADLRVEVATVKVAMTKDVEDRDDCPRRWRPEWLALLRPWARHGLPYVRISQAGIPGDAAIGRYKLSYP
jgi:hypothetical protein